MENETELKKADETKLKCDDCGNMVDSLQEADGGLIISFSYDQKIVGVCITPLDLFYP